MSQFLRHIICSPTYIAAHVGLKNNCMHVLECTCTKSGGLARLSTTFRHVVKGKNYVREQDLFSSLLQSRE